MNWRPFRRVPPAESALLDYWDGVIARHPISPVPPAAAPEDLTSIVRSLQVANTPTQAPYADRLLNDLLATYDPELRKESSAMTSTTVTAPLSPPHIQPKHAAPPIADRRYPPVRRRSWNIGAALTVALVALLIVAGLAGIWTYNQRHDNTHILAPPDATPTTEASPDVPMYRGNPERTGVMPGPGILGTPVELWSVQLGGSINSAPAIVDDVLYLGVGDGGVYAMDTVTGATIWQFEGASSISSSPAVVDGLVYVGSDDGTLYALSVADGSEVWTFPGTRSSASVVVDDGVVYTGSDDGFLYAIDATTGEERWNSALGESASRSPAVANGIVYMGSADGVLHAVDSATGEERWTFQTEGGGLVATTAIGDGTLIQTTFNGDDNFVYALDPETGDQLWRFTLGSPDGYLPPAIGEDLVFVPSNDSNLYTLDLATGEQVWSFATGAQLSAAPALIGDTLYLGGHDGFQYALDAATGVELWRYAIQGEVDFGPVVTGGVLYTGTTFGNLYAITGTGSIGAMTDPAAVGTPAASPVATPASPVAIGDPATLAWETTGEEPALNMPTGVVIDPNGNIWVANAMESRFIVFNPAGEQVETWGEPGNGDGQFNFVVAGGDAYGGIAFAPDGSFYVVDTGNHRVQHFSADRQFLNAWGERGSADGQFIRPTAIGVDSQGSVYVSDDKRDDVQKFSPDGTYLYTIGGSGSEAGKLDYQGWLSFDAQDNVWVADGEHHRVQVWNSVGNFITGYDANGALMRPGDVEVDVEGRIFVIDAELSEVFVLAPDGQVLTGWTINADSSGVGAEPYELVLDGNGNAYVIDFASNRLLKYQLNPPLADEPLATPEVAIPVS